MEKRTKETSYILKEILGGRLLGGMVQLCVLMLNGVEHRVVANLQLKQE